MPQAEISRALIDLLLPLRLPSPFVPQCPHPKQAAFLMLPHREVLFGGAAGGGKSSALLMAALQYVDVPGYAALILRSTYASLALSDGLIPRSHEWLAKTGARWNSQDHTWYFPSGAALTFGYLEHSDDRYRYASSAYQFIGWEELCEFRREEDYRFLFSRVRRPAEGLLSGVPLRVRATANPVGPGVEWVKQRFISSRHEGRFFLPSTCEDNPSLDSSEYEKMLDELPPIIRQKLRHGDWSAIEIGQFFPRSKFRFVDPDDVPRSLPWMVRFWDLAATEVNESNLDPDWTVGLKMARDEMDHIYVFRPIRFRSTPDVVQDRVEQTAREDGKLCAIRMFQDPGQAGKAQITSYAKLLSGYDFDGVAITGSKEISATPFASQVRHRNVYLVDDGSGWMPYYLDEMEGFPYVIHDDQVDASSGAYNHMVQAEKTDDMSDLAINPDRLIALTESIRQYRLVEAWVPHEGEVIVVVGYWDPNLKACYLWEEHRFPSTAKLPAMSGVRAPTVRLIDRASRNRGTPEHALRFRMMAVFTNVQGSKHEGEASHWFEVARKAGRVKAHPGLLSALSTDESVRKAAALIVADCVSSLKP
jgi:predicted phage terminase large subunit-like protein